MKTKFILLLLLSHLLVSCSASGTISGEESQINLNSDTVRIPNETTDDSYDPHEITEHFYCGPNCFLGIIPGTTSFEDANNRFNELGIDPYLKDGESLSTHFIRNEKVIEMQIVIKLLERRQKVSQMRVTLEPRELSFSDDHLVKFSPVNLLFDYGIPEKIHYNNSNDDNLFNLFVMYETEGFLYIITGDLVNNSVCLSPEVTRISSLTMVMDDSTDDFSVWDGLGFNLPGNEAAVFQMTPEEIYNQVILDQDSCFEVLINSGN